MEIAKEQIVSIPKRKIKAISKDPEKTANAINLTYVNDGQPGIQRIRKGNNFIYKKGNKVITGKASLLRIKRLVIPPAWEGVWICSLPDGHLQATGIDAKKRKQYKYHPNWNALRNHTKYFRLLEFAKVLPAVRQQLDKDLALPGLPADKVLALIVRLMEKTNIRIGNNFYEKLYGSFGLTTLKDRHVAINGTELNFFFKGKKGVEHKIKLKSKKLAALVKSCRDIAGKELFQYYNESGKKQPVDSGMVNNYIKRISGADFSAKDFRTWSGTVVAFVAFKELGIPETITQKKKNIAAVLDRVSAQLGNTRAVCKKYYVHPVILSIYECSSPEKYLSENGKGDKGSYNNALYPEEQVMIKVLEQAS